LAKYLSFASLFAIDSSEDALHLARQNALRHEVADAITFLAGNLLEPLPLPVDMVVSNPPYVRRAELNGLAPEVSQYEPRLALDGGPDGLEVIRQLLPQAREKLKAGGSLLVEIGATQGSSVAQLARQHFSQADIQLKRDLAGRDRLLVVREA
jgi:release factor glutamine methyltransferase